MQNRGERPYEDTSSVQQIVSRISSSLFDLADIIDLKCLVSKSFNKNVPKTFANEHALQKAYYSYTLASQSENASPEAAATRYIQGQKLPFALRKGIRVEVILHKSLFKC